MENDFTVFQYWIHHGLAASSYRLTQALVVLGSLLLRWLVARHDFSGRATPPMHGDFEAQRHWLELTWHVPMSRWYSYKLDWWGLDYPPLTAYVSLMFGAIAHFINPSWVALTDSQGNEAPGLIVFMRASVIIMDLLVYYPTCFQFIHHFGQKRTSFEKLSGLAVLLYFPGLILIDHGHFQYNLVMLGLLIFTVTQLSKGNYILGAIAFTLCLLFKQMALYYALPVFCFLLGKCANRGKKGVLLFLHLGSTVLILIGLAIYPFRNDVMQVVHRIFPFGRGLYEDKVANIWCALSPFIKFKQIFPISMLVKLSLLLTIMGSLPACVAVFLHPKPYQLLVSLISVSLVFFLVSFQVHEKTILVPMMPAILLLALELSFNYSRMMWKRWVTVVFVSVFSMYPLLRRENLDVPYAVLNMAWYWAFQRHGSNAETSLLNRVTSCFENILSLTMGLIHVAEVYISPPSRYPHLFVLLNVFVSCAVFICTWIYTVYLSFAHD